MIGKSFEHKPVFHTEPNTVKGLDLYSWKGGRQRICKFNSKKFNNNGDDSYQFSRERV